MWPLLLQGTCYSPVYYYVSLWKNNTLVPPQKSTCLSIRSVNPLMRLQISVENIFLVVLVVGRSRVVSGATGKLTQLQSNFKLIIQKMFFFFF